VSVAIHPLTSPWGRFHLYSFLIDAPELAIVDTGIASSPAEGMAPALSALGRRIEDVRWILLTHGHIDHIGGAHALWELTGRRAEIVIGAADAPMLRSRRAHVDDYVHGRGRYLTDPEGAAKVAAAGHAVISGELEPTRSVLGGEELDLGGVIVTVHAIPGHTVGSVAYAVHQDDGAKDVFVGDAVQVHGAANGFPGYVDPKGYRAGLGTVLALDPEHLYLGHPYRTTDGTPYGVELDRDQARAALTESLEIEARISEATRRQLDDAPEGAHAAYTPFSGVAKTLGYEGDPTLEPSPFFTTMHAYAAQRTDRAEPDQGADHHG
jgi:hydroxyacylglutathione hydrolase